MSTLYIPPAVNMLIPRGTFGGAGQQPRIWPIGVILHTNASNTSLAGAAALMARTTKGQEFHCQQEAPGTGRIAGRIGQYVDFEIRADNNYKGNSFTYGGRLAGFISIETADHGSPYEKSWTDLGQRRNLEDLLVWLCRTLRIPPVRCASPYSPGLGYHSMWGYNTPSNMDVNPWTNTVGKICPGPGKIREFPDLLAAVARRVAGEQEDDLPTPKELWDFPLPALGNLGGAPAHAALQDARAFARAADDKATKAMQQTDTLEQSMLVLNSKLEAINADLQEIKEGGGAGSIDLEALAEAVADALAGRLAE